MFNWLRRWKNNRNRAIFSFWDGSQNRAADPLTAWRALRAHKEFDPERDIEGIRQDNEESLNYTLAAVREAFGVKAFADGGLTEAETLALLVQFMGYIGQVKKNISPPQISPPSTEAGSSETSTTKPASGSTSTSIESSCVNQAPC
jgi:hypothetical protein